MDIGMGLKKAIVLVVAVLFTSEFALADNGKKLIYMGVDSPEISTLPDKISEMEKTPFDGWVFNVTSDSARGRERRQDFTWEGWSMRAFSRDELRKCAADLKATKFKRFTDNFIRVNTAPADVDWFDSFDTIVNNARIAGWVAKEGGLKGVLFDTEDYGKPLFDYHHQRDAKTKSFEEYAVQVRKRGAEIGRAMQADYPDITILMSIGHWANYKYGYPEGYNPVNPGPNGWGMWTNDPKKLEFFSYGLLSAFVDGMVEAAGPQVKLVDGSEFTYMHLREREFIKARHIFKENVKPFIKDPERYYAKFTQGFGVWIDPYWSRDLDNKLEDIGADPTATFIGWSKTDFSQNYWQPDEIQMSLTNALKYTDKYVWLYSERTWFWGEDRNLPEPYMQAIRKARVAAGLDAAGQSGAETGLDK